MTKFRPSELDIVPVNGVPTILANGKGVSLYNKKGLDIAPLSGWVWEIKAKTALPMGLKFVRDDSPEGHYTLCPTQNMSVHEFVASLEKVVIFCQKIFKKTA
jgi:hypothetical protein